MIDNDAVMGMGGSGGDTVTGDLGSNKPMNPQGAPADLPGGCKPWNPADGSYPMPIPKDSSDGDTDSDGDLIGPY